MISSPCSTHTSLARAGKVAHLCTTDPGHRYEVSHLAVGTYPPKRIPRWAHREDTAPPGARTSAPPCVVGVETQRYTRHALASHPAAHGPRRADGRELPGL
jgi:hypothetical protein